MAEEGKKCSHIKGLVPSGGQGPSEDSRCTRLLAIDREDRKWIGKAE